VHILFGRKRLASRIFQIVPDAETRFFEHDFLCVPVSVAVPLARVAGEKDARIGRDLAVEAERFEFISGILRKPFARLAVVVADAGLDAELVVKTAPETGRIPLQERFFLAKHRCAPEPYLRNEAVPVEAAAPVPLAGFLETERDLLVFQTEGHGFKPEPFRSFR